MICALTRAVLKPGFLNNPLQAYWGSNNPDAVSRFSLMNAFNSFRDKAAPSNNPARFAPAFSWFKQVQNGALGFPVDTNSPIFQIPSVLCGTLWPPT